MQLKRVNKRVLGGLVALTAAAGLVASTMGPAAADPTRPYAATGSDTIQDVWNGLTNDFGAVVPSVASWNAFVVPPAGTATGTYTSFIQTKTGGSWFLRPSGSGEGQKAVSAVWDPGYASHQYPAGGVVLNHEDVDFGRSSGGPAAGTGLKFLPFARDAVAIAYNPYSTLTAGLNLTTGQITELYNGVDNAADNVVTFSEQPATASTVVSVNGVVVHPKIPQSGSGTRGFFLGAIGVTTGQLAPYIPVPNNLPDTGGLPENDGTVLPNDGDLIPFSAAQWIAQKNGKQLNTTTGLELSSVNGSAPTTGSAPTMSAGPAFGHKNLSGKFDTVPLTGVGNFNRDTYDVVPASFLTGTSKQQALMSILGSGIGGAGGGSVISAYGFGVLSYIGDSSKFLDGAWKH
jgi:ABC-type phosphate transport system substrate-binding protein